MAVATAYFGIDMESAFIWFGTATITTASQIRVQSGAYTQDYFGSFTYNSSGLAGGTVTASDFYYGGLKYYTVTGGNFSAVTINNYLNANNPVGLLNYIFSGNDTLNGSPYGDFLKGYSGDDVINGGGGTDTAIFQASYAASTIVRNADGTITISSPLDGTDRLTSIEYAQFSDRAVSLINTVAPTITSSSSAITPENVSTSQPIYTTSATDPDVATTIIYSISGGADANLFNINPTSGVVTFKTSPNFETPTDNGANNIYDILVRAADGSLYADKAVAITVTDVYEPLPYTLSSGTSSFNEGTNASFMLSTTNVTAGTVVPYSISGTINSADVVGGSMTGNVSIGVDGKATIIVALAADNLTEGSETLTVTAGGASASTIVNDTSLSLGISVTTNPHVVDVMTGQTVKIDLVTTRAMTIAGAPSLQLSDSGIASYISGSGTNHLVFSYTVGPNDKTLDLNLTGLNLPAGASIKDSAGEALTLSATDLGLQINQPKPSPTSVFQEIAGLYAAIYNRAVDANGMSYWVGVTSQQPDVKGLTVSNAATTLVSATDASLLGKSILLAESTYYNQVYAPLNDASFVDALYLNLGGTHGDPGGLAYWQQNLQGLENSGLSVQVARASVVGSFVRDLISTDLTQWVDVLTIDQMTSAVHRQAAVVNKIAVSLAYENASAGSGGAIFNAQVVGDGAFNAEVRVINNVNADPSTVSVAIIGIYNAVTHQDLSMI